MASPGTIIRCNDGTELSVEWRYEGAEQAEWLWNDSHYPLPLTPFQCWIQTHNGRGIDRAWQEAGMEPMPMFRRFQLAGPFSYVRMSPYDPERMATIAAGYREVARKFGSTLRFWEEFCQPRIERGCRDIAAARSMSGRQLAEIQGYAVHQTFTSSALLGGSSMRLRRLLEEELGDDTELTALEVIQGGVNASQAIDAEIWSLAEQARRDAAVAGLLEHAERDETLAALRREPGAAAFVAAFDELIVRHGSRSVSWDMREPTWSERPEAPLSMIRAQLLSPGTSPHELARRTDVLRSEATERVLARLPERKHDEFRHTVTELEGYVSVREGRAYWQMVLTGEARLQALRMGSDLVRGRRLERADDVLFLTPDDYEGTTAGDLRSLATEHRTAWERWCNVIPPRIIGTSAGVTPTPAQAGAGELRGAPASRGTVTGPARIMLNPEDGARLRRGDILVCVMTTPAWTPLFSIVSGVITETGGALSHPAITAREYGIPAVVAARDATSRIREGQTVTIDGAAGLVTLHE